MLYNTLMIMSKIIRLIPYDVLLFLGRVLGNLYYMLVKKQRERAVAQMMPALNIGEEEARQLVRKSFVNLARNVLDIFYMPNLNEKNLSEYIEIDHLERMKSALAEGHGVVVLTGHIGTWEWLSASFTLNGLPVTAIAKLQPNAEYSRVLDDLRATIHVEIFNRGTNELRAAGRALKDGKILGFLADQDAGPGGAFINFLGKVASTPLGPAVFSRRFNAPVVPAFIIRKEDGRHIVKIGEPMHFEDTGDTDADLLRFTEKMTAILENVIRENPTQWLWFQKRWNTPPERQNKNKHHTVKVRKEAASEADES
ncbi:MAG: lysophospholipid acyltransferase family protein [Selenomonadaceae bacterium]|nr:lysophospholipid acyltransferase family protein [Selenomonadaceae bacterium]